MELRVFLSAAFLSFLLCATQVIEAQTPAKATTKKTTVTKKPAVKKTAVTTKTTAKKAAATTNKKIVSLKGGEVYLCDGPGPGSPYYHKRQNCEVLQKCRSRILFVPKQMAKGEYSRKQCKKCF